MIDADQAATNDAELIAAASALAADFCPSRDCTAASVAAALMTQTGRMFTGVCIDTTCSLGFCAEHAAVAEMLKARESHIASIVAVHADGKVIPPCGRCRELLWQVDPRNAAARVLLGAERAVELSELLPHPARGLSGHT